MASRSGLPRITLAPQRPHPEFVKAVVGAGGVLVEPDDAEAIIWTDARDPMALAALLETAPGVRWVQLPFAGIENFVALLDAERVWTCGKGVYARPVAEMALGLGLAGLRGIGGYAQRREWSGPMGTNLVGGRITIVGGGGICEAFIELVAGWECEITVVRRTPEPMGAVARVLDPSQLHSGLDGADLVVLALALTPQTIGLIGRAELEIMAEHAWLVNVARGRHIVTDDLVEALVSGAIGGAGLDVTDPEPLPADHRLWELENCIITPHVGNTPEMAIPLLAQRMADNVGRFARDEPLIGLVDTAAGY